MLLLGSRENKGKKEKEKNQDRIQQIHAGNTTPETRKRRAEMKETTGKAMSHSAGGTSTVLASAHAHTHARTHCAALYKAAHAAAAVFEESDGDDRPVWLWPV